MDLFYVQIESPNKHSKRLSRYYKLITEGVPTACARHDRSGPLDGVEVGDGDDGSGDAGEDDPTGHDAEQEVLERRGQARGRGLRDLGQHERRRHGRRGQPGGELLLHGRGRRPDGRHPRRGPRSQGPERGGAERLLEPGDGERRRDGGQGRGGHGESERTWVRGGVFLAGEELVAFLEGWSMV